MTDEAEQNHRHAEAMRTLKAERDVMMQTKTKTGGLLLVHTGDGKGKSTAGFGMVARALGWGQRVGVVQYIKGKWITGERQFFKRFPDQVRFETMGEGFTWETQDRIRDIAAAEVAWVRSLEAANPKEPSTTTRTPKPRGSASVSEISSRSRTWMPWTLSR